MTPRNPLAFGRLVRLGVLLLGAFSLPALATERDLEFYLPPGEVVWLNHNDNQYLLLEREYETPYLRGNLLFIPEWNTHPLQSHFLSLLYKNMPAFGWNTHALQPPLNSSETISWNESADSRYPSPAAAELREPFKTDLLHRIEQAQQHSAQYGGANIWVVEGISAGFVVELLNEQKLPAPDALIVVGIYFPQWQLNENLATTLARFSFPILDLVAQNSNSWVSATAELRQKEARKHQHLGYRQRLLSATYYGAEHEIAVNLLRGWLNQEGF